MCKHPKAGQNKQHIMILQKTICKILNILLGQASVAYMHLSCNQVFPGTGTGLRWFSKKNFWKRSYETIDRVKVFFFLSKRLSEFAKENRFK